MTKNIWILFLLGVALMGLALALASGLITQTVQPGDTITVNYTLKLDDSSIYSTTAGGQPLQATLGEGKLVSGLEETVIGMKVGEKKTVTIPPEKGYGAYQHNLVEVVDRSLLPEGTEPVVGQRLEAYGSDGKPFMVTIASFDDKTVTADLNPPLAGRNLTFDIELLAIGGNATPNGAGSTQTSWILFLVGVLLAGFVFYNRMNPSQIRPLSKRRVPRLKSQYR